MPVEYQPIISQERSVIPACDFESTPKLTSLISATTGNPKIGGYKIGFDLVAEHGMVHVGLTARSCTNKPLIYDHQKGATDIPDMGRNMAQKLKRGGFDALILFPQAGPETQSRWTKEAQDAGLGVFLGLHMTHPRFLVSEGGYIADDAPERAFRQAVEEGVTNFILPGNKVEYVAKYCQLLTELCGPDNFAVAAPGFITQGGEISEFTKAITTKRWHAIVGSGIYKQEDMKAAAELVTSQL
ncbi:orotidine 5'-phosphate decarboxylase [Candidatus Daviesbacteria bacterium]|nr:orotidine 5'-phosphate decarboxylase [Candidatus Daviesbacteria bacterium]